MVVASTLLWIVTQGFPSASVVADTACPTHSTYPVEGRPSPRDSITFMIAGKPMKVCYGRPSARGRTMIGGNDVPYGELWRTGANEPTTIFTPIDLSIAGLAVPAGKYSLYTVPGEKEWEIVINHAVLESGHVMWYTDKVKAQELGLAKVKSEPRNEPLETFTISAEPSGGNAKAVVLEWERTRVPIPISAR